MAKEENEILASEFDKIKPYSKLELLALIISKIVILLIAALALYFFVGVPNFHVVHICRHHVRLFHILVLRGKFLDLKIFLHMAGSLLPRRLLYRKLELLFESYI